MTDYPELEVLINGRYCRCQVLTRPEFGAYPTYIAVNSLDRDRPGEYVAAVRMGCWMSVNLSDVIRELNEALYERDQARDAMYGRRFSDRD